MRPGTTLQLRWGIGVALVAALLVVVLAFVPDPFFRQHVITTTLDDVNGVAAGTPVLFRGAEIGSVRSVNLDAPTRLFAVRLGVRRDWRPSRCAFAEVAAANPLTTPHIELVAIEGAPAGCDTARLAAQCTRIPPLGREDAIDGCRRAPDLVQTAAAAIGQAAAVAATANEMATRLAAMMGSGAGSGPSMFNMAKIAQDSTATLTALSGIARHLDSTLEPNRGDVALTLANVRRATGRAGEVDIASINGTLREVHTMVAQNQKTVADMLAGANQTSAQVRTMLEDLSTSLTQTSGNLARASDSAAALTERLSGDPTFAIRGRKFADPPPPSGASR